MSEAFPLVTLLLVTIVTIVTGWKGSVCLVMSEERTDPSDIQSKKKKVVCIDALHFVHRPNQSDHLEANKWGQHLIQS